MNEEIKLKVLNKIKEYGSIVISRHIRPDGDAVGASFGLKRIIEESFKDKKVYIACEDYSDYVAFIGKEDGKVSDEIYEKSLLIVLDTAGLDRISNSDYEKAKEILKIDHHIDVTPYGSVSWVEDFRSSCCEMITDFYDSFKDELVLTKEAAEALYTGMITDSGHFKYAETTGDTLRMAALLLDTGIDIQIIHSHLDLEEYSNVKFKSYVYDKMQMTENGVLWMYVDEDMQRRFNLSREDASNVVDYLADIKGSIIWLVFIDNFDGSTRVRLRSRFADVNKLAEKYHGGGHAKASGATVYSEEERIALLKDADILIKEFKDNNFYM